MNLIKETRVTRTARRVTRGMEIYEWLQQEAILSKLIFEIDHGAGPPIGAISTDLIEKFGDTLQDLNVRQFIGLAVKFILQQRGYVPAERGVRMPRDPVFTAGMVYKQMTPASLAKPSKLNMHSVDAKGETLGFRIINAILDVLTPEEYAIVTAKLLPILKAQIAKDEAAETTH